jgi:tetratricopeptide (TPR) repeat protein
LLLEAEGRVVTKADLMERAWPGLTVEEGNLTVQIATLRKLLGARPDGTEWIVTVPRVGYRLPRQDDAGAVYDLYLRALAANTDESIESNAVAYTLLREALTIEPENALILSLAAWALEHRTTMGWPLLGEDDKAECLRLARRGLQHSAGHPRVMVHCGMALLQTGKDYEGGMAVLEAAAAANPNDLRVAACSGIAALHCGDIDDALERLHRALRLGPRDPDARFSLTGIAMAEIFRGNYEAAVSFAARSLALNAHFDPTYWMLIAAHAHLGNMAEARQYLHALEAIAPGVTLEKIQAGQPAKDPGRFVPVLEGLARAGMRAR